MTTTTTTIDALTARTKFGELIEKISQKQSRFLINRRGKPKAVILSVEDYLKNIIKQPELLTRIQTDAQNSNLDQMTDSEIDTEITTYRQTKEK